MKNQLPLLLIALLFNCFTASAQSWLWGAQGNTALKSDFISGNVATNRTGNVYHTGSFETSLTFGTHTLTTSNGDAYLVKYDPNGNVLWAKQSTSNSGEVYATSVATDDSDNSYITGWSGFTTVFEPDTLNVPLQVFLVKYDPNGNVVWAKQPSKNNIRGEGYAVTIDKFGHEYVTGDNGLLLKYDRNGNLIWTVAPTVTNPLFNYFGYSVAADKYGNIYISGPFQDTLKYGTYQLYSANEGVFIAKFNSNGNVLWVQQSTNTVTPQSFNNLGSPECFVACNKAGDVYVAGTFADTITFGSYTFTVANDTSYNFFLMKFNSNGTIAWGKQSTLVNRISWDCFSVCTDDSNHIYISGGEDGMAASSFIFANDTFNVPDPTNDVPGFLLKLDSSGHVICGSTLSGGGVPLNSVASDSTGKFIYVGGAFDVSVILGNDTLIDNTGEYDPYVGRWQPCDECDLAVTATSPSRAICNGQSIVLKANGETNYIWSPSAGLSATTGDSVIAAPAITTVYTITGNTSTCTVTSTVKVTVDSAPSLLILPQPPPVLCFSFQSDTLKVATKGSDFTWSPSEGLSATTGISVIANPSVSVTYTVTGIDSLGCPATGAEPVTILQIANRPSFYQHGDTLISSAKYDNQWYRNDTMLLGDTSKYLIITTLGNYYVEINNEANGCSTSSDTVAITTFTGINQLTMESGQLTVYPNPFSNQLTIISKQLPMDEVDITDELGQVLLKVSLGGFRGDIDLSNLPSGMYFITVVSKTDREVLPVMKQ